MRRRKTLFPALAATLFLASCGVTDARDEVVYPHSKPIPRGAPYAEQRTNYSGCPGDAEELASGSICPPDAQCFEVSGGGRCIVYEK